MENITMGSKEYIDTKIADLRTYMDGKFAAIDGKFIAIEGRMQGLRDQYKGLENRIAGVESKIDAVLIELKAYRPLIEQLLTVYSEVRDELKELREGRQLGFGQEDKKE